MPTFNQLVHNGRFVAEKKAKAPKAPKATAAKAKAAPVAKKTNVGKKM